MNDDNVYGDKYAWPITAYRYLIQYEIPKAEPLRSRYEKSNRNRPLKDLDVMQICIPKEWHRPFNYKTERYQIGDCIRCGKLLITGDNIRLCPAWKPKTIRYDLAYDPDSQENAPNNPSANKKKELKK
jgi:hypothetical protein